MHDAQLRAFSGLVDLIYAAAADASLWPEVLDKVGAAVSEGTQTLLFLPGRDPLPGVVRCGRTPDSVLFPFLEYYSGVNVLAEPCDRMFAEGAVRFSHHALADSDFERTEFYADFFRRNGLFYSCGIKQHGEDGGVEYLSLQRERSREGFSPRETAVLELLMPHLSRALALQTRLARQGSQTHTAQAALAAFGKAVLAVDLAGRVVLATPAAEALLAQGSPLVVRNGVVHAKDSRADAALQHRLRAVLGLAPEFVESRGEALLLPPERGRQKNPDAGSLRLVLLPMRHGYPLLPGVPGALLCLSGGSLAGPQASAPGDAMLRELFGLSPLEARIAGCLAAGAEVKAIAVQVRRSEDATRFHLKQVFRKTGTSRQGELVRLLAELPRG